MTRLNRRWAQSAIIAGGVLVGRTLLIVWLLVPGRTILRTIATIPTTRVGPQPTS